ncbi:MAG: STAS domain-containing protein [Desulfobacteraceae bacterium]|nr:STAS domain-containing protein [Desulfobacteraceae bacterium]
MLNPLAWLREKRKHYKPAHLKMDVIAGLTVALIVIPQSMAYAQLAGLPSYYGLYASLFPPMVAAIFGSSRQLATGPVAMVSLMTAVALEPLAILGSEAYIAYAMLLSLMVGGVQLLLGVLRLGLIVNLLSHPVISGFSNAAAIIIATSQLPKLFGIQVDSTPYYFKTMANMISTASGYTHWPTLIMGLSALVFMAGLRRLAPRLPNILIAVVITTGISWGIGFERHDTIAASDIASPPVVDDIMKYNRGMDTISQLAAHRTDITDRLHDISGTDRTMEGIALRQELVIIDFQMDTARRQTGDIRKRLRGLLFVKNHENPTMPVFQLKTDTETMAMHGRTWRLKVGHTPLETSAVHVSAGGEVVGHIPGGLPAVSLPLLEGRAFLSLLPYGLIIALVGFMEAISIAKAMAAQTGQRIDPNRELIGQGLANISGSFTQSFPCAGSFSRSAVNLQSGALTGLSSVFAGLAVVLSLFFLTPLLYYLPQAVLAAIIMLAVAGLININGLIHAWRAKWYDGAILVVTFVSTLAFAPHLDRGIAVGVALSLMVFIYNNMRPKVVDLSLGLDHQLHDVVSFGLKECKYVDVVRFDGPLFYANASYLEDQIRNRRISKKLLRHIIIVANGVNDMDASGEEVLSLIVDRVRSAGMDISFCGINESVMSVMKRTHLLAKIGENHIYPTMNQAIRTIHGETHSEKDKEICPLTHVVQSSDPIRKEV